jgi:hypothetical protein
MFRECFGMDFAAADLQLAAYLPVAIRKSFSIGLRDPVDFPAVQLRPATPNEISRIRGEYERFEISYVAAIDPRLRPLYAGQARRTLRAAYDRGDRDPRLLASLGLCECDAGNDESARPFLEAAVAARVIRPRAYHELARIRFAGLLRTGDSMRLSTSAAEPVRSLLLAAQDQSPPIPEVYELMAELLLRRDSPPSPRDFEVLDKGVRLFPRRVSLIVPVAILFTSYGDIARSRRMVADALALVTDETERSRLLRLQTLAGAVRQN